MPFDFQHLLIYLAVIAAVAWLVRGQFKRKGACGGSCGDCGAPIKRNPVIENLVRRQQGKEDCQHPEHRDGKA